MNLHLSRSHRRKDPSCWSFSRNESLLRFNLLRSRGLLILLVISGWTNVRTADAAMLVVTNLADHGPGTLRQFITNSAPGDTIAFATNGTITLTTGELLIDKD